MKLEDYKAAIDEYQAVLTINPDDDEAQEMLKTAIEKAASSPQSAPVAQETKVDAAPKKTDHGMASITMAELYVKQNHLDKALEVYEEILKKDPEHAAARQKMAELKSNIAVNSLGSSIGSKSEASKSAAKEDAKKAAAAGRKQDAKFTDEDIFQAMGMDRVAKPIENPAPKPAAEPAKIEPKTAVKEGEKPQATPTTAYSPEQIEVLKGTLAELASITGIRGCFLTGLDGISVVSIGENGNNEALEKQVLTIFKDTNQSAAKLEQGSLRQVLVTAETGHILLVSFAGGILVVLADHQINLGMLRLAMDGAAKKIEKAK
jgi:predicted regulator of Ras-like GTPase activity (Roadblock/LC7/MglB family)